LELHATAGGSTSIAFPIGTAANYAPASIHLNTGSASSQIQVGVAPGIWSLGTSGTNLALTQPSVDATWMVSSSVITNLNVNLEVMWSPAMEVHSFNRTTSYISHFANAAWDMSTIASASVQAGGMFSLIRTGLTSLSPFSVFDQNAVTALDEVNTSEGFLVFPNPVSEFINIQFATKTTEPVTADIYNAVGTKVACYNLNSGIQNISTSNLAKGNYFIRFYNSSVNSTKAFVKN
jgi:hypothetical protein